VWPNGKVRAAVTGVSGSLLLAQVVPDLAALHPAELVGEIGQESSARRASSPPPVPYWAPRSAAAAIVSLRVQG
jgi:hypothetical protein